MSKLSLFLSLILLTFHPSFSHKPNTPQRPCTPPHQNTYPFCNTSLSIQSRIHSIISLLTLTEKIDQLYSTATGIPRLGIPPYEWWSESLHGIATNGPGVSFSGKIKSATSFPQVIVSAASFNRRLWFETGAAVAVEGRAMYNSGQAGLTFWGPNINVFRDPRWGRGQETTGEDPMVASAYAVQFVKGFQGENWDGGGGGGGGRKRVLRGGAGGGGGGDGLMLSACCKHYIAYDLENWNNFSRYSFNAVVSEQDMQDTYEPPFRSCITQSKASCLMCSYNQVNGIPACGDKKLLQKARINWGFQGYVVSDCDAIATIYEYQNYTKSPEDAVAIALKAGTDINCGTYMLRHTESAIKQGKLKEEDLNKALFNLFSVQIRLGLFDGDPINGKFGTLGEENVCTSDHKLLALESAKQGIVLVKNENKFLPLEKNSVHSLAVIGPNANDSSKMGGGYTGIPCDPKSVFEGLEKYAKKTSYASGCFNVSCKSKHGFKEASRIAKKADYVIIVAGLDLSQETEDHDRYSLLLPGHQTDLVDSIAKITKKPVILVLTGGGPLDVSFAKENPQISSIIWIGYPGEAGADALAQIIFGDHNPSGRLPITWYPESFTRVPMNDMSMRANKSRDYPGRTYRFYTGEVVYGFGHGLSYTNYTHKFLHSPINELKLSTKMLLQNREKLDHVHVDEVAYCDSLRFYVSVSVTNDGDVGGRRVVMLFSRAPSGFNGAPKKELIGFENVDVEAKGHVETRMLVDPCKHFSIVNEEGKRILPLGNHGLILEDIEYIVSIQMW